LEEAEAFLNQSPVERVVAFAAECRENRPATRECRELALLGSRPMLCSSEEQQTFLEDMGSSVRDPKRTARIRKVMLQNDLLEGPVVGADAIAPR
jgi:hypothetical protein